MNCPIEDRCDFNGNANIYLAKDYFGENDFDFSDFDDFDDDDEYEIQLSYNTEPIERFQAIIEEVANISGHIGHIRGKCFQDNDIMDRLDDVRESLHNIVERLRELQEESAIDEMYEFICKNY